MEKATIKLISEEEASPEVKAIYDDAKRHFNLDFVPNIIKAMAYRPQDLKMQWEALKEGEAQIGKEQMYILSLVVDIVNDCTYCINFDTAVLKNQLGYTDERIEALVNMVATLGMYNTYVKGLDLEPDVTPVTMARRMAA